MRQIISILGLFIALVSSAMTVDEVPNVHIASRDRYVSNPSGVLSESTVRSLDAAISDLWRQSSSEMVVVAVDRIDPSMTPEEFATALFEKWGIGKSDKDNGILVLVSRDDRAVQIRTGYGLEGVVPDIIAGRIIRDRMIPHFREGDYDGGTAAGVQALSEIILDPSVRDEIMSSQANDSRVLSRDDFDGEEVFAFFLKTAGLIAGIMLLIVLYYIYNTRHVDDVERWRRLNHLWLPCAVVAFVTLGLGAIPFAILSWKLHRIRRHKRNCSHCGTRMQLIDEVHDNDYLSPTQDLEERLNSVDYDVWHCPNCAQTDIYPFINRSTRFIECPRCHARAMSLSDHRILRQPTTQYEGEGVDIYYCRNCGNHHEKRFRIERKPDNSGLVAGAILGSALGGRGGFGGGGFSGGSFGGGNTGGGGAGGRW
ncbi:MAG: TPM domain-containing protein [Duncaniella sp.]|nr:TPM domain-containing protein [Duncaniella sp.]